MIKRPLPLYLADALVEVELFDERERKRTEGRKATRYALTIAGEQRDHGRLLIFPWPTLEYDANDHVTGVNLATGGPNGKGPVNGEWLVNDGVCGTLPVVSFDQRTARALADQFVKAVRSDVVDQTPGQVTGWCDWWTQNNAECRMLADWPTARVQRADHLEGQLVDQAPEVEGARGPFTPAVQPDPIDIPDQAPALVRTLENTEAVN